MSRTSYAYTYLDNYGNGLYQASGITERFGFKSTVVDGERIYCKENPETNTIACLKVEETDTHLILSVWVKYKDDSNPYREYDLGKFDINSDETKILYEIEYNFQKFFGDRLVRREMYIYE